jgi:hypothetical protein
MAKLCIQQQLIHPPKKKLFIQPWLGMGANMLSNF